MFTRRNLNLIVLNVSVSVQSAHSFKPYPIIMEELLAARGRIEANRYPKLQWTFLDITKELVPSVPEWFFSPDFTVL